MALMSASRARYFAVSKIAKSANLIKFVNSSRTPCADERCSVSNLALFKTRKLAAKTQNIPRLLLARLKFLLKLRALLRLVFSSYFGMSRASP